MPSAIAYINHLPSITNPASDEYFIYVSRVLRQKGIAATWIDRIHSTMRELGWDGGGYAEVTVENLKTFNPEFPLAGIVRFKHSATGKVYDFKMANAGTWKPGDRIKWSLKEVRS